VLLALGEQQGRRAAGVTA